MTTKEDTEDPIHLISLILQEQDEGLNTEDQQFATGISESPPTQHITLLMWQ